MGHGSSQVERRSRAGGSGHPGPPRPQHRAGPGERGGLQPGAPGSRQVAHVGERAARELRTGIPPARGRRRLRARLPDREGRALVRMTPPGSVDSPTVGEVIGAVGDATAQLQTYVSRMVQEEPALTTAGVVVGFVLGGGLLTPLGARLTRAAVSNVSAILAPELLRRAFNSGGVLARSAHPDTD